MAFTLEPFMSLKLFSIYFHIPLCNALRLLKNAPHLKDIRHWQRWVLLLDDVLLLMLIPAEGDCEKVKKVGHQWASLPYRPCLWKENAQRKSFGVEKLVNIYCRTTHLIWIAGFSQRASVLQHESVYQDQTGILNITQWIHPALGRRKLCLGVANKGTSWAGPVPGLLTVQVWPVWLMLGHTYLWVSRKADSEQHPQGQGTFTI